MTSDFQKRGFTCILQITAIYDDYNTEYPLIQSPAMTLDAGAFFFPVGICVTAML